MQLFVLLVLHPRYELKVVWEYVVLWKLSAASMLFKLLHSYDK
jgi:hypothetical protein